MTPTHLAIASLCAAVLLWGSAFTAIAMSLESYAPTSVALGRFLAASVVLVAVAIRRGWQWPAKADMPRLAAISLAGISAYHVLLNVGQQVVPPSVASMLIQTTPVFTALLAAVWLRERLPLRGWVGIAVASVGALLLVLARGDVTGFSARAGLIVGAAVATSLYFVGQQPLAKRYGGFLVTVWSLGLGMLPLLVFLPALAREAAGASFPSTAALLYAGLLPGAAGYVLWNVGLRELGPSRATVFLYASPLVAVATEWAWRGTKPGAVAVLGGGLAIAGVALVNASRSAMPRSR